MLPCICFYHSSDFDGKCSAAIVKKFFKNVVMYPINYDEYFPFDIVDNYEKVVMVDFGLQPFSQMIKLHDKVRDRLIWIDHHKTAIDEYQKYGKSFNGLREIGKAGCELTWEYFYPEEVMPKTVSLLGRYDVWDLHASKEVQPFQYGLKMANPNPGDDIWIELLNENDLLFDRILRDGRIIETYQKEVYKNYCDSCSFDMEWEGHKFLVANIMNVSSQLFDTKFDHEKYDAMMCFGFRGERWSISLYTDKKDIDLSVIAKKYNGGGHAGACGFSCDRLPFTLGR